MKISILVKIHENLDLGQNSRKILILINIFGKSSVKSIWVKIFPKSSFGSKFSKNIDLGKQKFKNPDFGQHFWKYWFEWKLSKNLKFDKICRKISIFDKIVENSRCWSKFHKMSILV